jgi:hypothetical protein
MAKKYRDPYPEEDAAEAPQLFCWLCARPMGAVIEWHHPIPKSRGGREKQPIHPICHQAVHSNFTNSDLEKRFSTAETLLAHEEIRRFVDWVVSKPPDFHAPTRKK